MTGGTNKHRKRDRKAFVRSEMVKCGKRNCTSCPHGPYSYRYSYDKSGRLTKKYLGPTVDQDEASVSTSFHEGKSRLARGKPVPDWICWAVLGVPEGSSRKDTFKAFCALTARLAIQRQPYEVRENAVATQAWQQLYGRNAKRRGPKRRRDS